VAFGIIDLVCGVIILLFAILGAFKGFTKQVIKMLSGIVVLVGSFLLLKPVFDYLHTLDFFQGILTSLEGAFANMKFLDAYAATLGKTTGYLFAEYLMMAAVFVLLAVVIALLWKLLKCILVPISHLPGLNIIDKLLGCVLGIFWGCLLTFGILYVWFLLKDWQVIATNIPAIGDIFDKITVGDSFVETYIINNFDKVNAFFVGLWEFIKAGVVAATAKL